MKKIFSVFMCFTFLAACLGGIPASAEFDNLLWNPVVWCTSAQVINGEDLVKLTDGSRDTSLPSAELSAATTWRIFLDTAPDGSTVPAYNKLKLYFDSYNAMKISVDLGCRVNRYFHGVIGIEVPLQLIIGRYS